MIVLSAGMPKAGSGWYYNLTNDLLVEAGHQDAREVRERYGLRGFLWAANCTVRRLDRASLGRLAELSRGGNTFVVKTHRGPTRPLRKLMDEGVFKVTYVYRDLRDVIVSAIDRGEVMREGNGKLGRHFLIGPYKSFAKLRTVPGAVRWARWRLLPVWRAYTSCPGVHVTTYERLHTDAVGELARLAEFLGLDVSADRLTAIADRYRRDRFAVHQPGSGMHLNKGVTGRFREALSADDQALCRRRLGPALREMGYPV